MTLRGVACGLLAMYRLPGSAAPAAPGCSAAPQPCPGSSSGRTFCETDPDPHQCSAPKRKPGAACPPCPTGGGGAGPAPGVTVSIDWGRELTRTRTAATVEVDVMPFLARADYGGPFEGYYEVPPTPHSTPSRTTPAAPSLNSASNLPSGRRRCPTWARSTCASPPGS